MPLKLSLRPGETFIVNGAVVRNGERRGVLLLETRARILREKDIMQPGDAKTPASQAYFAIMQMYLLGRLEGRICDQAAEALASLIQSREDEAERRKILNISAAMVRGDIYGALTLCRKMVRDEQQSEAVDA